MQIESNPQATVNMAKDTGLPVVWLRQGDIFKVVIDGHVFGMATEFDAFFTYFSSFSVFGIQWDSGAKYLVFVSSCSVKLRELSFA